MVQSMWRFLERPKLCMTRYIVFCSYVLLPLCLSTASWKRVGVRLTNSMIDSLSNDTVSAARFMYGVERDGTLYEWWVGKDLKTRYSRWRQSKTKGHSTGSLRTCQDSNRVPPEYKFRALPPHQPSQSQVLNLGTRGGGEVSVQLCVPAALSPVSLDRLLGWS
jgi:hypothetical protein